jgi:hypothetical protein
MGSKNLMNNSRMNKFLNWSKLIKMSKILTIKKDKKAVKFQISMWTIMDLLATHQNMTQMSSM